MSEWEIEKFRAERQRQALPVVTEDYIDAEKRQEIAQTQIKPATIPNTDPTNTEYAKSITKPYPVTQVLNVIKATNQLNSDYKIYSTKIKTMITNQTQLIQQAKARGNYDPVSMKLAEDNLAKLYESQQQLDTDYKEAKKSIDTTKLQIDLYMKGSNPKYPEYIAHPIGAEKYSVTIDGKTTVFDNYEDAQMFIAKNQQYTVTYKNAEGKEISVAFSNPDKAHQYAEALQEEGIKANQTKFKGYPSPIAGPREGSIGYGISTWLTNVLKSTETSFENVANTIRQTSTDAWQNASMAKDLGNGVGTVLWAGAGVASRIGAGFYEGLTFAVRPVQWGAMASLPLTIASDPTGFWNSLVANADDILLEGVGGAVAGYAIGKGVSRWDAYRKKQAWLDYKNPVLEEKFLENIPQEYTVTEKQFAWTKKEVEPEAPWGPKKFDKTTGALIQAQGEGESGSVAKLFKGGKWSTRPLYKDTPWEKPARMALTTEVVKDMLREGIPLYELWLTEIPVSYFNYPITASLAGTYAGSAPFQSTLAGAITSLNPKLSNITAQNVSNILTTVQTPMLKTIQTQIPLTELGLSSIQSLKDLQKQELEILQIQDIAQVQELKTKQIQIQTETEGEPKPILPKYKWRLFLEKKKEKAKKFYDIPSKTKTKFKVIFTYSKNDITRIVEARTFRESFDLSYTHRGTTTVPDKVQIIKM